MLSDIKFKKWSCLDINNQSYELAENITQLYVVLTRSCNAHCKFCEYTGLSEKINFNKFEQYLVELRKICRITTVHFTGGEPTLKIDDMIHIIELAKKYFPDCVPSVNTNGSHLAELDNLECLDNIALSRHAISDKDNFEIFGTDSVASYDNIVKFHDVQKIHLSCNLIKGYIDSSDKVEQYLEMAAGLEINDVGLVSLMPVNEFCRSRYVEFSDLHIDKINNLSKVRSYKCMDQSTQNPCCMCENYLYQAKNCSIISMYHRYAIQSNRVSDYVVYDNNRLRQGFSGNFIDLVK